MSILRFFLVVLISFPARISWANDHEAPAKDEHAAPADAHGGGESKAGDSHGEKKQDGDLPEWVEIQSRLTAIETKIMQKNELIKRLIEEKQHLSPQSPRLKEVVAEMVKEHKELLKLNEDYEKQNTIYKFRFPEKGLNKNRHYEHGEVKPLEQIEQELNIDGRLTRNQQKIKSQYKNIKSKEEKKTAQEKTKEKDNSEKSIEDAGPILLKK